MDSNFDKSLALVLKSEGGYINHRDDPGGETMMGVTKGAWSGWLKRPIQDGEMIKLTVADITPFYKALYWDASQCPRLPIGIDYLVFDSAVNMGVGRAVRLLQQSLGCVPDGVIGPNTMRAINAADVNILIDKFSAQKEQFYRSLKTFIIFGKGWLNRVEHVKQYAKDMLNGK
jgi:lysozyme family protein